MPPVSGGMALLLLLPFEVFLTLLFLGRTQLVSLAFLPIGRQPFADRVPVHPEKRTAQPGDKIFRRLPLWGFALFQCRKAVASWRRRKSRILSS